MPGDAEDHRPVLSANNHGGSYHVSPGESRVAASNDRGESQLNLPGGILLSEASANRPVTLADNGCMAGARLPIVPDKGINAHAAGHDSEDSSKARGKVRPTRRHFSATPTPYIPSKAPGPTPEPYLEYMVPDGELGMNIDILF